MNFVHPLPVERTRKVSFSEGILSTTRLHFPVGSQRGEVSLRSVSNQASVFLLWPQYSRGNAFDVFPSISLYYVSVVFVPVGANSFPMRPSF